MSRYQRYKILGCSGIAPVKAAGIENVDLTHIVSQVCLRSLYVHFIVHYSIDYIEFWCIFQHVDYNLKMKEILEELDLTATHAHTSIYG